MFNMPGKIPFDKRAIIKVLPYEGLELLLNGKPLSHENGLCYFADEDVLENLELTFNIPVQEVYIENVWVTHLIENNKLNFKTPIYRWLLYQVDNK